MKIILTPMEQKIYATVIGLAGAFLIFVIMACWSAFMVWLGCKLGYHDWKVKSYTKVGPLCILKETRHCKTCGISQPKPPYSHSS